MQSYDQSMQKFAKYANECKSLLKYSELRQNISNYSRYVMVYKTGQHSQLLNNVILKFNSLILLHLLGNIFPYCPAVGAIRRINSSNTNLPGRSMLDFNWECLYCDSSQKIPWNRAWALRNSSGLCPRVCPRAQAIFHRKSLLSSQYRYSDFHLRTIANNIASTQTPLNTYLARSLLHMSEGSFHNL